MSTPPFDEQMKKNERFTKESLSSLSGKRYTDYGAEFVPGDQLLYALVVEEMAPSSDGMSYQQIKMARISDKEVNRFRSEHKLEGDKWTKKSAPSVTIHKGN